MQTQPALSTRPAFPNCVGCGNEPDLRVDDLTYCVDCLVTCEECGDVSRDGELSEPKDVYGHEINSKAMCAPCREKHEESWWPHD